MTKKPPKPTPFSVDVSEMPKHIDHSWNDTTTRLLIEVIAELRKSIEDLARHSNIETKAGAIKHLAALDENLERLVSAVNEIGEAVSAQSNETQAALLSLQSDVLDIKIEMASLSRRLGAALDAWGSPSP